MVDELVVNPSEVVSERTEAQALPAPVIPQPLPTVAPSFVYALGQIEPRFPSLSIEKEFAQAIGNPESAGQTDRQTMKGAISERQNRYLARSLCWVFTIEGLETYILVPRDPADLDLLIDAFREEPRRDDLDVVIGLRSRIAPPEMCNGLALPIVVFDQVYSFDRDSLIDAIPKPDSVGSKELPKFRSAAGGLFDQLIQLADNAGATDEHRALNYLTVRYPRIYAVTTERFERNFSFAGVEVIPSNLSTVRSLVDVVFSYRHRETDVVEKEFVRVDVTEEFPFLVTKMGPYFDR
jgi:PatG Domain